MGNIIAIIGLFLFLLWLYVQNSKKLSVSPQVKWALLVLSVTLFFLGVRITHQH